jgi:hypothetical protein
LQLIRRWKPLLALEQPLEKLHVLEIAQLGYERVSSCDGLVFYSTKLHNRQKDLLGGAARG